MKIHVHRRFHPAGRQCVSGIPKLVGNCRFESVQ